MPKCRISTPLQAYKLRDIRLPGWEERIAGRWHYRNLIADPLWRSGWISFDTVNVNPDDGQVYCGLNAIDGDLLYRFDPATGQFTSLNTQSWTDVFDVKIHRSLLYNPVEKCFYFATSLLHDVDQQPLSPGGKLVRFDPVANRYDVLGIPIPKLYIQSLAADFERGLIYGFTYPAEALFRFDLHSRTSETLAFTGNSLFLSQPHNPVVDAEGWLWGTYAETRAWDERLSAQPIRLFKYHPDGGRFCWFDHGLSRAADKNQLLRDPTPSPGIERDLLETRHKEDYGFCDSMLFDGRQFIYVGTSAGVLCRIDTRTSRVEKIANIMAAGRFPALGFAPDGVLYGAGGSRGNTQIMRWQPGASSLEVFSRLGDPESGESPARIHDLAIDRAGCVYLAENDNHSRSSYLWKFDPALVG